MEIGQLWESRILQVCDEIFLYEQIENYNEPFIGALREYDDLRDLSDYEFMSDGFTAPYDDDNKRKLAYRLRLASQKYEQGLHSILDKEMIKLWDDLYNLTDRYCDGWLSSARALLADICRRNLDSENGVNSSSASCSRINVLVTSGSLIPSLVKCMLFRLDGLIPHENVYSSWEVGKLQCFKWIREQFPGPKTRFCVIGDGPEECSAAETMRWPFVQIDLVRRGSGLRFPGLTMKMLGYYIDAVYGDSDSD
ncbi:eyes absent-like protein isoform X2 [Wolffia australiana]